MFKKLKEKKFLTRLIINTDETMLRDFADLTDRLNFESFKIIALKQCLKSTIARARFERSKSLLVTNDVDEIKKRRCELSRVENYVKNNEFLFVNYLHNEKKKQDEEITFFFVRKFVYFLFFEKLLFLILNLISRVFNRTDKNINRLQDAHILQKRRKQEQQRLKLKRQKLKRQKLKQKQKRQKQKILKRLEQERQEQKRLNKKSLERERLREKQRMIEQEISKKEQERKKKEKRERQKQKKRKRQQQKERKRRKQEKRER